MKLSPISLALLPLLTVFTAQAAVYQIVELDTTTKVRSTSGVAATPQGEVILNGSTLLDFEIDLDEIDFESEVILALFTDEQIEEINNGIFSSTVKSTLINYLSSQAFVTIQPVGLTRVIRQTQNAGQSQVVLRDTQQTKNNDEFAYAANNSGYIAGIATAPSFKSTFTPTAAPVAEGEEPVEPANPYTAWIPEAGYLFGYVVNGQQSTALPPQFSSYGGGMSAALDINNTNLVAGFTSTGITTTTQETIDSICTGFSQPLQYCLNQVLSARSVNVLSLLSKVRLYGTVDTYTEGYEERAALWQYSPEGTAVLNRTWGFLGEKGTGSAATASEDYTVPVYYSRANAVNDSGIAVGSSLYSDTSRVTTFLDGFGGEFRIIYSAPHATIFNGDSVTGFIDTEEWVGSVATDINNQNLIAGYALKNINSSVRSRFFTYDMNTQTLRFPEGFFSSSGTEPLDMNNQGQVVGRAEVIVGGTTSRRINAFLYDNASNTFTNLNSLVGCDAPYTLVEASSINDDGVITATALINRVVYGYNGEPVLDENGDVFESEQATTVLLQPIANGQVEDCNAEDNTYERNAGSLSALLLMLLGTLPFLRRRSRARLNR
ncbi:DUF3466 family protein [Alishewanella sp. 16-MA]|uniref:DUF3466 family protein n=1 Tax=Alishewanella maricola TaxID=2795740 RepID=A0ABS8C756_9ALTE|nr:DUF3466 family protein [Alishewanella maricola]MCB5228131.1 DUF3466 family protein [Alishewanella maricola]